MDVSNEYKVMEGDSDAPSRTALLSGKEKPLWPFWEEMPRSLLDSVASPFAARREALRKKIGLSSMSGISGRTGRTVSVRLPATLVDSSRKFQYSDGSRLPDAYLGWDAGTTRGLHLLEVR